MTIAGTPCTVIRLGFVGELSYELHHPSDRSVELWNALLEAGHDLGIRPHGLDALRLLRLEKGHILIGQDTDYDSTPEKLGMTWAVKNDKPAFVGKMGLRARRPPADRPQARPDPVRRPDRPGRGLVRHRRRTPDRQPHLVALLADPSLRRRPRLGRAGAGRVPHGGRVGWARGDRRRSRVLRP